MSSKCTSTSILNKVKVLPNAKAHGDTIIAMTQWVPNVKYINVEENLISFII
jgi:hypothetical protein